MKRKELVLLGFYIHRYLHFAHELLIFGYFYSPLKNAKEIAFLSKVSNLNFQKLSTLKHEFNISSSYQQC